LKGDESKIHENTCTGNENIPKQEYITLMYKGSKAMSKTSFKIFCIEFYANHTGKTGPEVYAEFEKSGLLRELDEDYEDLHGMGMEALMQMIDEYLGKESAS
jgi:hypothetical protein